MKRALIVLGSVGVLVLMLTVNVFAAGSPQQPASVYGPEAQLAATPTATPTAMNQYGLGMGRRGGMMGGGRMGSGSGRMQRPMGMSSSHHGSMRMSAGAGATPDQMGANGGFWGLFKHHMGLGASGAYTMTQGTLSQGSIEPGAMMQGVASIHDDVTHALGMSAQDLYDQMSAGKSLAQIAAGKGVTEQQLMDTIMAGRKAAFAQAVYQGHLTQTQADEMLKTMETNFKTMVNTPGAGGWGMMWDTQPMPQVTTP